MDIPNLSTQPPVTPQTSAPFSIPVVLVVIVISLLLGFGLSRMFPKSGKSSISLLNQITTEKPVSADNITSSEQLVVGKIYGNSEKTFKDTATGVVEKGNINGEGTHILNREGGPSQRASLTSSAVDLDLFVGKKVEVKGETNASTKTSWLLDVGSIKILE
jgi:hypothetical protein